MSMLPKKVVIYDTTLRDGTQAQYINFSVQDKIRIAEKLDAFGIQYIEGGFPGSNEKDIAFFQFARKHRFKNARLAAFGSTCRAGVPASKDPQMKLLVEAKTPVVTIFGKSWLYHVRDVLRTTPDENLRMIEDSVRYLKKHVGEVIFDAEHYFDGYKSDSQYALKVLSAAAEGGADWLVLCDTNGGSLPSEIGAMTSVVTEVFDAKVGIHTHDDTGFGVANAIAAVQMGAAQVQGTINGYGERTGNCNLTAVIPNLQLKLNRPVVKDSNLRRLRQLSYFVDEVANIRPDPRAPYVGDAAFAHKGGAHVNAVSKSLSTYEHIAPERVGNRRRVLVGELSGRTTVLLKARELGTELQRDSEEVRGILEQIKKLEHDGFEFESADASFHLLVYKSIQHHKPAFELIEYHISMRNNAVHTTSVCEATLKIKVGGKVVHTVAEGDGPVNALDGALRYALAKHYPEVGAVKLTDYKVRILDSKTGTAAKTRVLIESTDGHREWSTVGVSDNIIEASWQALVDSIEYYLLICRKKGRSSKKK